MIRNETFEKIVSTLKNCEDLDDLTARELANRAYTSPSTISRFVKKMGYSDFKELKINLQNNLNKTGKEDFSVFMNWQQSISNSFEFIENEDFEEIIKLLNRKILVYVEREYDLLARIFVDNMMSLGCSVMFISKNENLEKFNDKEVVIFAIGNIPNSLYFKDYKYIEIKFVLSKNEASKVNVHELILINEIDNYGLTSTYNFRISCINMLLALIYEEFSKYQMN